MTKVKADLIADAFHRCGLNAKVCVWFGDVHFISIPNGENREVQIHSSQIASFKKDSEGKKTNLNTIKLAFYI